jgi:hypothetical protein
MSILKKSGETVRQAQNRNGLTMHGSRSERKIFKPMKGDEKPGGWLSGRKGPGRKK